MPRRTRRTLAALSATAAVAVLLTALSPLFPRLGSPSGDAALRAAVSEAIGTRGHHLGIGRIDAAGTVRFAGFGADEHTEFEIGSVTKTFTGTLLAQAIENGEVTGETTLGEVFGQRAGHAAEVTLTQLATHTSGLPRVAPGGFGQTLLAAFLHTDPYRESAAELIGSLAQLEAPTPVDPQAGEGAYSNYAVALLGAALAEATGTDYPTLLRERILDPLGMDDTYLPVTRSGLRPGAPHGYAAGGVPAAAWTAHGTAPAGGIRSTPADLLRYVQATMTGELAGSRAATTPAAQYDTTRTVGLNWFIDERPGGGRLVFHNGMTGGYAAIAGYTDAGDGIVVLADTARSVDAALAVIAPETAAEEKA